MPDNKTLTKVGRYFRETDPQGFASWMFHSRGEGASFTLKAAGQFIYEVDPEMFAMITGGEEF